MCPHWRSGFRSLATLEERNMTAGGVHKMRQRPILASCFARRKALSRDGEYPVLVERTWSVTDHTAGPHTLNRAFRPCGKC